jgi:hypothetical protein
MYDEWHFSASWTIMFVACRLVPINKKFLFSLACV